MFEKFINIHLTLPFGNEGRGTKVYLWPFVGAALICLAAWSIDTYIIPS